MQRTGRMGDRHPKFTNCIMEIPFLPEWRFNEGLINYHCPSRRPCRPPYCLNKNIVLGIARLRHQTLHVRVKVTSLLICLLKVFFPTNTKMIHLLKIVTCDMYDDPFPPQKKKHVDVTEGCKGFPSMIFAMTFAADAGSKNDST